MPAATHEEILAAANRSQLTVTVTLYILPSILYVNITSKQTFTNNSTNTYLLTPQGRVLLEKLIGFQLVKQFTTFYGTRRFITAFTSARHLSLL